MTEANDMSGATATRLLLLDLQPMTLADGERLERGLRQLTSEDPTLCVDADGPSGTVTIGAIGELQLEIVVDRLNREFHVEAGCGRPRVSYLEILTPAGSVRHEPVMRVEVTVPPERAAEVTQDLDARRGVILSHEDRDGRRIIAALVPLAKLFGFDGELRRLTLGRGSFSQEFDSYQPVPANPDQTDDDRTGPVRAPLRPASPPKPSAIALPEPGD